MYYLDIIKFQLDQKIFFPYSYRVLGTTPAKFGLIWSSGFRGEDLDVKVYDVRQMPSDGKSSGDLWPGALKNELNTMKNNFFVVTESKKYRPCNRKMKVYSPF